MAKTKITSGEQSKKCPFCPFKTTAHSAWKDHMAECYETRYFCKKCNYSTLKKVNYLRHLKRNHIEPAEGTQSRDQAECKDNSEESSSKELPEQVSSGDEDWLEEDPDISLGEEIQDESMAGPSTSTQSKTDLPEDPTVGDPTVRKRTQPLPVYTPSKNKAPRLEVVSKDVSRKMVDVAIQTEPVLYTKSIKTTTIVREHGRKVITVKREKMV